MTDDRADGIEIPAATVVLGRDGADGLQVLMLRRTTGASFAAGAWVFPGGRVDAADAAGESLDSLPAARRAAVRETLEEAGIRIDGRSLFPMARWSPSAQAPKRFLTWMLFGRAPEAAGITVDGGEITDHRWIRPDEALRARDRGELSLLPPTWVTLQVLSAHRSCASAISAIETTPVEHFRSSVANSGEGRLVLWHGDAGYESGDPSAPGGRHRLVMARTGWRYERTAPAGT